MEKPKSVTIYFPKENDLQANDSKITDIIKNDKLKKMGVKFLAIYESLKFHSESVLSGQTAVAIGCAIEARKLQKLSSFINEYKDLVFNGNYKDFNTFHAAYDNIANTSEIDSADEETITSAMSFLEEIKSTFLNQDQIADVLMENTTDYHSY